MYVHRSKVYVPCCDYNIFCSCWGLWEMPNYNGSYLNSHIGEQTAALNESR